MPSEYSTKRCRRLYARLISLYPKPFHERFGESMQQTFNDLLREHTRSGKGVTRFMLWIVLDTAAGICGEHGAALLARRLTRRLATWALSIGMLLLIPLVLTIRDGNVKGVGWNWSPGDFLAMGSLLFGTALIYELIAIRAVTFFYRAGLSLACATTVLLLWINGAVGIIGDGPVNTLFVSVPAVFGAVALFGRLTSRAMARASCATALTQLLIPIVAFLLWHPSFEPGFAKIIALNAVFVSLWLASAWLFRRADRAGKSSSGEQCARL